MTQSRIGTRLGQFSVGLTLTCAALATLAFITSRYQWLRENSVLDYFLFGVIWSYILVTPVSAIAALVLGDRTTRGVRVAYGVLLLWLFCLIWMGTITF
jgi:hypothetical protein